VTSFISFLAIGGLVGLATLLIREAIAWLLPADLPLWYGVSVVLAYSVGIVLSFFLQGRVTFSQRPSELTLGHFSRFAAVAISGALVALVASLGVRYFFVLDRRGGLLHHEARMPSMPRKNEPNMICRPVAIAVAEGIATRIRLAGSIAPKALCPHEATA
jgi:putative flippase GtrA